MANRVVKFIGSGFTEVEDANENTIRVHSGKTATLTQETLDGMSAGERAKWQYAESVATEALDLELSQSREGEGSYQVMAADLELDAGAGTSDAGDTDFLAGMMGHVMGGTLTKTHNYLAGVIGATSISGNNATVLPNAALLGIAMDGVTDLDGVVVAHIDGDDPSSETHVGAMFKARMVNNHAD